MDIPQGHLQFGIILDGTKHILDTYNMYMLIWAVKWDIRNQEKAQLNSPTEGDGLQ